MQIKSVMFCSSVQQLVLPDGKQVIAVFDPSAEIQVEYVPGVFSLCAVFCLSDLCPGHTYSLSFKFLNPENACIAEGPVNVPVPADYLNSAATAWLDLRNVDVRACGTYMLQLIHEETIVNATIEIKKVKEQ